MSELIQDNEVNIDRLESIFNAEYYNTIHDDKGNLIVRADGSNVFVSIDTDRKIIIYYAIWLLKERAKEMDKLKFANQLNQDLILVRFCVPDPDLLFCEYDFLYEGGVTSHFIVGTLKLFLRVFYLVSAYDKVGVLR